MSDHATDPIATPKKDLENAVDSSKGAQAEQLEQLGHALLRAIFETDGDLDPMVRQAIYRRANELPSADSFHPDAIEGVPRLLSAFVDKVIQHAYKVTDSDVKRLLDSGYSEDAIFEAIISAAAGAGMSRIERGLHSLAQEERYTDAPAKD